MALNTPHVSAYSLTYEEGTRLTRMRDRGDFSELDDDITVALFEQLAATLHDAGYEQYEISNFAKPGWHSRHNSAYWDFTPYLGLGASAHSFDGKVRRYNPSSLKEYLEKVDAAGVAYEEECETADQLYDEWVMTRLRTRAGMCLDDLENGLKETSAICHPDSGPAYCRRMSGARRLSGEAYAPWRDAFGYGVP